MQIFWVLALGFAIFVATFAVQNAGAISVKLLAWEWQTSTAVVVLGAAAAGALVAGLLGSVRQVSLSLKIRNLQSKMAKLEKQLRQAEEKNKTLESGAAVAELPAVIVDEGAPGEVTGTEPSAAADDSFEK